MLVSHFNASAQWIQVGDDIMGQEANEGAGFSIDLNAAGTLIAIGANKSDAGGNNSGKAKVYRYDGTQWNQQGADLDGSNAMDEFGYCVRLNADGMVLAVGAPNFYIGSATPAGYVRVYEWNGSNWSQRGSDLTANVNADGFGSSLDLSADGNMLIVGAPNHTVDGQWAVGRALVYEWDGQNWTPFGNEIIGSQGLGLTGTAVNMNASGNIMSVGEPIGRVRVFDRVADTWMPKDTIFGGTVPFGRSTSMDASGNTIAVGGESLSMSQGGVRVFAFDGNQYVLKGSLIAGDQGSDFLGFDANALSADGNILALGALTGGVGYGKILQFNGTDWEQIGNNIIGDEIATQQGRSAALSADGSRVALGTPYNTGATINTGIVHVWENQELIHVNDASVTTDLIVYPNPTTGGVQLSMKEGVMGTSYTLLDSTGRIILSDKTQNASTPLSLEALPAGVYVLRYAGHTKRIVKE
jgi:hypothetical protein